MKRLWPAALAVVVLLVLYLVMRGHGEDTEAPPRASPSAAVESSAPRSAAPAVPPAVPAAAPQASGDDPDDQRGSAATVGTPALAENPPPEGAKKPKMDLDEKLAETAKHIQVMKHRSELLQTEIDALDKAGKTKEAHEHRIVLERLQKHMKELQTAIDEHKEPM